MVKQIIVLWNTTLWNSTVEYHSTIQRNELYECNEIKFYILRQNKKN